MDFYKNHYEKVSRRNMTETNQNDGTEAHLRNYPLSMLEMTEMLIRITNYYLQY